MCSLNQTRKFLQLFVFNARSHHLRCMSTTLSEVGKFETPKTQGKYEAGQLFMHKIFGYRGVVLFPWAARLYDRNLSLKLKDHHPLFDDSVSQQDYIDAKEFEKSNGKNPQLYVDATYYQTLIDQRDVPHIRAQPEGVTFLGRNKDPNLYVVPGLDYVSHEDILPYMSTSDEPIKHDELFNKFLVPDPASESPRWSASESLHLWHKTNYKWLELTDVHRETTEGIRVTVIPFFMGVKTSQQNDNFWWWRYCVRLENLTNETFQLRERHWRIYTLSGTLDPVRGRGVVGQEPYLTPKQPAFQYSSNVSLQTPSGYMWGTYRMERENGSLFEIRIPGFSLESKQEDPIVG